MPGPNKTKGKTKTQIEVETRAKEATAMRMRRENSTYEDIAQACGWASVNTAKAAVKRAMARHEESDVEEHRRLEHVKLNMEEEACLQIARFYHVKVDHGKVIEYPEPMFDRNGEAVMKDGKQVTEMRPLRDWGPSLAAWKEFRQVCARRAALGGYDAPMRRILEVITEDRIMAEINRMEHEMVLMDQMATATADDDT